MKLTGTFLVVVVVIGRVWFYVGRMCENCKGGRGLEDELGISV